MNSTVDDSMSKEIELIDCDSIDDSMSKEIELIDSDSVEPMMHNELESEANDDLHSMSHNSMANDEKESKSKEEIVMSDDSYSCGAASFATILNKLGVNISLSEAKIAANTTINGTTMKGLVDAAAKYNLTAYGVYADISSLNENFMVHMNINGCKHWSVIKEISKDKVTLADSSLGCVEYDLKKFNEYYTNNSLIILQIPNGQFRYVQIYIDRPF